SSEASRMKYSVAESAPLRMLAILKKVVGVGPSFRSVPFVSTLPLSLTSRTEPSARTLSSRNRKLRSALTSKRNDSPTRTVPDVSFFQVKLSPNASGVSIPYHAVSGNGGDPGRGGLFGAAKARTLGPHGASPPFLRTASS